MGIESRAIVPAHPLQGDIVIHQLPRWGVTAAYLLTKVGGRSHTVYSTYVQALAHAERRALMTGADVWYTSDDYVFSRLAQSRRPA
jgi:hypothetical protein